MRVLGQRSLSSWIKRGLDAVYYVTLFLAVLVLGSLLLLLFVQPLNYSVQIPVHFKLDPEMHSIHSIRYPVDDVELVGARGTLLIQGPSWVHLAPQIVLAFLGFAVFLYVISHLRSIFQTLKEGDPFVSSNARRIRYVGLSIIIMEVISAAVGTFSSLEVARDFQAAGLSFETNFDPQLFTIFVGVVLIVIAEVFRLGAQLKGDLESARTIQMSLVPSQAFHRERLEIHYEMRAANTVGGDYFDVIELDEGKVGFVIADVSGKGMPASLLMALLHGSLPTLVSVGLRGVQLVSTLNRFLFKNTPDNRLVTLFYGEIDPRTGELQYVNAGHNAPFLLRASGQIERLNSTAIVLAVLPDPPVEGSAIQLRKGDQIFLFTDGISEAWNREGEEYGEGRLRSLLDLRKNDLPDTLIRSVLDEVESFCKPLSPRDDRTIMLLRLGS